MPGIRLARVPCVDQEGCPDVYRFGGAIFSSDGRRLTTDIRSWIWEQKALFDPTITKNLRAGNYRTPPGWWTSQSCIIIMV